MSEAGQECWYLEGFTDDQESIRRIPISALPFRIGRQRDLSFTLDSRSVSKVHAEIYADGRTMCLRDLGSLNGTYVNGERLYGDRTLSAGDVISVASHEFRVGVERTGDSGISGSSTVHVTEDEQKRLGGHIYEFQQLMSQRAVVTLFQPVVEIATVKPIGYEILGRGGFEGLPDSPAELFRIAKFFHREPELSELFRVIGMHVAKQAGCRLNVFSNTHPEEISRRDVLLQNLRVLRDQIVDQPMTLEIHEGAITDLGAMRELRNKLADLSIQIAYDDFGAEHGQGRLLEIAEVPPDFLKFDIVWIRDIDSAGTNRQWMLENLVRMAHDMGIATLAEGVETQAEADVCAAIGFQFAQGFHYGKPVPVALITSDLNQRWSTQTH